MPSSTSTPYRNTAAVNFDEHGASLGLFRLDANANPVFAHQVPKQLMLGQNMLPFADWLGKDELKSFKTRWPILVSGKISEIEIECVSRLAPNLFLQINIAADFSEERPVFMGTLKASPLQEKQSVDFALLSSIVEKLPCAVTVKDASADFKYLLSNKYAERIFKKLDGKLTSEIFSGDALERVSQSDNEALASQSAITCDLTLPTEDGGSMYLRSIKKALKTEDGKNLIVTIFLDYGKKKEVEDSLDDESQLLSGIMKNISAGIVCYDPDDHFKIVLWNRKMQEITGIHTDEALNKTLSDINAFPGAANTIQMGNIQALEANGEPVEFNGVFNLRDGREIVLHTLRNLIKLKNGKRLILSLCVDVTVQSQTERERDQLLVEIHENSRREKIFSECLMMLVSETDFDVAMNKLSVKISEMFGADVFATVELDEKGRIFYQHVWTNENVQGPAMGSMSTISITKDSALYKELAKRKPVLIDNVENFGFGEETLKRMRAANLKAFIMHGIFSGDEMTGLVVFGFGRPQKNLHSISRYSIQSIVTSISVVAERKRVFDRLRASDAIKAQIIDNISIPIMLLDTDRTIVHVNKATQDFWNKPLSHFVGEKCNKTICSTPDGTPAHCPWHIVKETKQPKVVETFYNGRHLRSSVVPVLSDKGEIINYVDFDIDITDEVEKTKALQLAKDAAEEANRAKSNFIANVSHEIRTPLNAILGLSELLATERGLREDVTESISSINTAGKALLSIINNVLELSRLDADKHEIPAKWMKLGDIFEDVRSIFQRNAQNQGLYLEFKLPEKLPEIFFSEIRLRQILLNIVGNAIKFTDKGGVSISCIVSEPDANFEKCGFKITIQDSGCGISEEDQKKIFDPFVQSGRELHKKAQGTGLGLAIVSKLTQALGGTISLESKTGEGSKFTLLFKEVQTRDPNKKAAENVHNFCNFWEMDELNVWILDDIKLNCIVLSRMLDKIGMKNEYMISPDEMLERIQKGERPDLILTDMWMPEMTGEVFVKKLREIPGAENIPAVAVTADSEATQNFSMKDFSGILLKPITIESLSGIFSELCGKPR